MTDEFDFDFDVDRGRSASRTENRDPEKEAPGNGNGRQPPELDYSAADGCGNGRGGGNGCRRFAPAPPEPDEGDWLSIGDDDFSPGDRSPLRESDDGTAGPPTPGEARNFAKEARRRASRRPSPILDLDDDRERLEREDAEPEEVDFESVLEKQPQKS